MKLVGALAQDTELQHVVFGVYCVFWMVVQTGVANY